MGEGWVNPGSGATAVRGLSIVGMSASLRGREQKNKKTGLTRSSWLEHRWRERFPTIKIERKG